MKRSDRPSARLRVALLLCGLCLLAVPRGPWPDLPDAAWRIALWIDAARVERTSLPPPAARAELLAESVLASLLMQGLLDDWQRAAEDSLLQAMTIGLPYAETLSPNDDRSIGFEASVHTYAVSVPASERLRIATRAGPGARGGLIVDVLDPGRVREGSAPMVGSYGPAPLERRIVLPADTAARPLDTGSRSLLVRVQATPEARGRFAILLDVQPALSFPVDTDARSPVRSRFGVARDGGRRQHHGIDIFADRGTAVLAAADGVVVRTGDSTRGGLHVWQRAVDERGERLGSLYYAHLDRVDVTAGTVVRRGDALGTVGNTGNARTTPPHLHFGLYRRFEGPVDPLPLTGEARRDVPDVQLEAALPRWLQVLPLRANLRASPDTTKSPLATLSGGQLVRIESVVSGGDWVRVQAAPRHAVADPQAGAAPEPAARVGWVARALLGQALDREPIAVAGSLRAGPQRDAAESARLDAGTPVVPLGRFGDALRVRTKDGLVGWMDVNEPAS